MGYDIIRCDDDGMGRWIIMMDDGDAADGCVRVIGGSLMGLMALLSTLTFTFTGIQYRESWDQIVLALVLQARVRLDWGEQGADDAQR